MLTFTTRVSFSRNKKRKFLFFKEEGKILAEKFATHINKCKGVECDFLHPYKLLHSTASALTSTSEKCERMEEIKWWLRKALCGFSSAVYTFQECLKFARLIMLLLP